VDNDVVVVVVVVDIVVVVAVDIVVVVAVDIVVVVAVDIVVVRVSSLCRHTFITQNKMFKQ